MTDNVAVEVDNVSKVFSIEVKEVSLRENVSQSLRNVWEQDDPPGTSKSFYALRNINFTINKGESVAFVGRNGAGKSTLLRIIAKIMRPSTGIVRVYGQYVSLFGLGAGFIDEMIGRKNIYLNAAIHGMSPTEVTAVIKDIIDFADIGLFIDVPVKNYSTGMQARLAFSIAVHVLPEIVLLDEVLTVGDMAFQEKCQKRILRLRDEGRTILFVSHSALAVRTVCERAIWLEQGRIVMDGAVIDVLDAYQQSLNAAQSGSSG